MTQIFKIFVVLMLALYGAAAYAGYISLPSLVFVNLDERNRPDINEYLRRIINSGPKCWNGNSTLFYMKRRPPALTNQLVARAVADNRSALSKLSKILLTYRDEEINGFDGLIVFSSTPEPRLIGISAGPHPMESFALASTSNQDDVEDAFCAVMPPVIRRP